MKIAFVVHDYYRGTGHSRYVVELATRFSREHEVHVFANRFEKLDQCGVIFHKVPAVRASAIATILTFGVSAALRVPRDFDVIHCQGFCGPRGNIITAHICNEAWSRSLAQFTGGRTAKERVFNFFTSRLENWLYRGARDCRVIAISRRVADDVVRYYGCPAPIRLIYHGVDLETFSPRAKCHRIERRRELGVPDSEMVFLYVGDLRKGARQCIRALARLRCGHLMLASRSAPEPYAALARECGVSDRVHLIPHTSRIQDYYGAADALLLPTPYDAFALVVTEAMATSLPVVVSRAAGASELIVDGENGLILDDPADEAGLAAHMSALLQDPVWAASLGHAARLTAEQFSWDAIADQTMSVYRELATRT
ncbi:MAG TPA: glycosyltransferase family 4 protein [Bryobacteraceae bacterium]|nr:glycosyltransferase family 4 protein [Bryobacteraceae bacterium]